MPGLGWQSSGAVVVEEKCLGENVLVATSTPDDLPQSEIEPAQQAAGLSGPYVAPPWVRPPQAIAPAGEPAGIGVFEIGSQGRGGSAPE